MQETFRDIITIVIMHEVRKHTLYWAQETNWASKVDQ